MAICSYRIVETHHLVDPIPTNFALFLAHRKYEKINKNMKFYDHLILLCLRL